MKKAVLILYRGVYMKNNKKQGRCPFSPLTLLAVLLLIRGMLAIILPVLKWDAEVSAEADEYE